METFLAHIPSLHPRPTMIIWHWCKTQKRTMGALRIKVGDWEASLQSKINKRHFENYWRRQIPTHLIY